MPPKKRNADNRRLPPRWRWWHGKIFFRVPAHLRHLWDNKESFLLGSNEAEAYRTWTARLSDQLPDTLTTMHQVCDRYALDVVPAKSVSAQKQNTAALGRIRLVFGAMHPGDVKPTHAYRYFDLVRQNHGLVTAKRDIEVLRHTLTMATQWGVVDRNPLIGQLRLESPKPRAHLPSDAEIRIALENAPPLLCGFIKLSLMTALRRGDLLRLTLDNIEETGLCVAPHKTEHSTGRKLIFEWTDSLRGVIDEILALPPARIASAPLFITRQGKPYIKPDGTARAFDSCWARYMDKLVSVRP